MYLKQNEKTFSFSSLCKIFICFMNVDWKSEIVTILNSSQFIRASNSRHSFTRRKRLLYFDQGHECCILGGHLIKRGNMLQFSINLESVSAYADTDIYLYIYISLYLSINNKGFLWHLWNIPCTLFEWHFTKLCLLSRPSTLLYHVSLLIGWSI